MRRALALMAVSAAAAASLAACGGGGAATTTAAPDKAADAETLDNMLTREMAAVSAYDHAISKFGGKNLALERQFRAQEQEHIDAIVKALRGLGAKAEPEEEEIESAGLESAGAVLDFLYEVESVSVADDLRAISHLTAPWPRSLLGSIAANQAQHLVLLRQALGAGSAPGAVPEAFEDGTTPAPGPAPGAVSSGAAAAP